MQRVTDADLARHVAAHAGLDEDEAARAIAAVLAALAARLAHAEAEALADVLPAATAAPLRAGRFAGAFDREALFARVAAAEGVRAGFAVEHTIAVCAAIGEQLPAATWARLARALPDDILALFAVRPVGDAAEAPPHLGAHATLAEGRPGSRQPLSEAAPAAAQADSVVRAANPHGDTKLSSARGLTQGREGEDLASGRPGPSRPLVEQH